MHLVTQKRLQRMLKLTRFTNVSEKLSNVYGDAFVCPCLVASCFVAIKKACHGRRNQRRQLERKSLGEGRPSIITIPQWDLKMLNQITLKHIEHRLRAGRFGDRIPKGTGFSTPVETGPVAHPASHKRGTG
jgi:hypothetical protein